MESKKYIKKHFIDSDCIDYKQAIRFQGVWAENNSKLAHSYDCKKCYEWWCDQVMIEVFKKKLGIK